MTVTVRCCNRNRALLSTTSDSYTGFKTLLVGSLGYLITRSEICIFAVCRAVLCIGAAYAVMRCLFGCSSVCLSVCLSRSYILSKRINISAKNFHRQVATPFEFFHIKRHGNIRTGPDLPPPNGASNAGAVSTNRDSRQLAGY